MITEMIEKYETALSNVPTEREIMITSPFDIAGRLRSHLRELQAIKTELNRIYSELDSIQNPDLIDIGYILRDISELIGSENDNRND